MQGWIKLFRKIINHWLYFAEPFDKFHAFIDLLILCNHSDSKIMLDGKLIEINSGEVITSVRKLCERWKWSNTKVKRFLNALEADGMITAKSDSKKTVIKVHNYAKYQGCNIDENDIKASPKLHQNDTETSPKHTIKNVKNDKNEENVNKRDKEKQTDFKLKEFQAPALKDVQNYINANRLKCNASDFFDYYTSNGWMVGQTPMRDWKAMCRKWSRTEKSKSAKQGSITSAPSYNLEQIKADARNNTEIKYD